MSYCIVSPKMIEIIEQRGFFIKQALVIQSLRLTSVSVLGGGFIQSMFRYGEVNFITDNQVNGDTNTTIKLVPKPNLIKEKILYLLSKDDNQIH